MNTSGKDFPPEALYNQAARDGNLEVIKGMSTTRSDLVNVPDKRDKPDERFLGFLPLHHAAEKGHVEVCKELVMLGAKLDEQTTNQKYTPLMLATTAGQRETCKFLIEAGAKVSVPDVGGATPLHRASEEGYNDLCEIFIMSHADVNAQDGKGNTPLHKAAARGRKTACKMLVDNGACIFIRNSEGKTAYEVAKVSCPVTLKDAIVSLLEKKQEMRFDQLKSFDDERAKNLQEQSEQLQLFDKEWSLKEQKDRALTVLREGAIYGSLEKVRGVIFNCQHYNTHIVDEAIVRDSKWTALHCAAYEGHEEVCEFLLSQHADTDLTDNNGHTAAFLAKYRGHLKVSEILSKSLTAETNTKAPVQGPKCIFSRGTAACFKCKANLYGCSTLHQAAKEAGDIAMDPSSDQIVFMKFALANFFFLAAQKEPQPEESVLKAFKQVSAALTSQEHTEKKLLQSVQEAKDALQKATSNLSEAENSLSAIKEKEDVYEDIAASRSSKAELKLQSEGIFQTGKQEDLATAEKKVQISEKAKKDAEWELKVAQSQVWQVKARQFVDSWKEFLVQGKQMDDVCYNKDKIYNWTSVGKRHVKNLLETKHEASNNLLQLVAKHAEITEWVLANTVMNGIDLGYDLYFIETALHLPLTVIKATDKVERYVYTAFTIVLMDSYSKRRNGALETTISKIARQVVEPVVSLCKSSDNPLMFLLRLAAAMDQRAKMNSMLKDDFLSIKEDLLKMVVAATGIPELDDYSNAKEAFVGKGVADFSFLDTDGEGPLAFSLQYGVEEFVALPQSKELIDLAWGYQDLIKALKSGSFESSASQHRKKKLFCVQLYRQLPFLRALAVYSLRIVFQLLTYDVLFSKSFSSGSFSVVLALFVIGYAIEEVHQFVTVPGYFKSFWNYLDMSILFMYAVWFSPFWDPPELGEKHPKDVMLSITAFVVLFRLLNFTSIFETPGVLVAKLIEMLKDVANFTVLYLFGIIGFAVIFMVVYENEEQFSTTLGAFLSLFSFSLGHGELFDIGFFKGKPHQVLGILTALIFFILSSTVLMNLLGALFAVTLSDDGGRNYRRYCRLYASFVKEYHRPVDDDWLVEPLCILNVLIKILALFSWGGEANSGVWFLKKLLLWTADFFVTFFLVLPVCVAIYLVLLLHPQSWVDFWHTKGAREVKDGSNLSNNSLAGTSHTQTKNGDDAASVWLEPMQSVIKQQIKIFQKKCSPAQNDGIFLLSLDEKLDRILGKMEDFELRLKNIEMMHED